MSDENFHSLYPLVSDEVPATLFSQSLLAVFDALPDALYLFDEARVLTKSNLAGAQLQSCTREDLLGRRCCEMFWRTEDTDTCVVDRALESGDKVEVEIHTEDGNRPTAIIVQPLEYPGGHRRTEALVIARDISDLRRAEADAIAQRSFMASIADLTPDEIYALDNNGRITWMNQRAEADGLLMLAGRFFIEFIAEDFREIAQDNVKRALAGQESECEMRALRSDGSMRDVESHTSPLWKDGEVSGVLVFLRDVTERKRAQELLVQSDKLRAVGELAAGVAHNLNNSLTVIQSRAQLLLMRSADDSAVKSLKVITRAVDEGTKTLRRILEFARRDSEQEFKPVELGDLITSSVEIARPKWQSKSSPAQVDVKIECNEPVYVMGELAELREVVLNLIFNAVDAMPEGGTMELGTRAEIESGCFWVADTGCGMPPETAARIFEPFYTTKGKRGTGLGLSASHGIITRHGGEIFLVSEPGEGTRFEVRLPICDKRSRFLKNSSTETANAEDEHSAPEEASVLA